MSIFTKIWNAIRKVFKVETFDGALAFAAKYLPEFGPALAAFSAKLPGEFASLEKLAEEAIALFKQAKGVTISKSLAIALAQAAFTAYKDDIQAEAEKLLTGK
jgi:hypothetical protein